MGTTCTMGVLRGLNLHIAHVGDSRAYLLRDHTLSQITKDHGWVAEQVEAGNLTIEEAKDHPYRNVVTRAIGIDKNVQTDTFTVRLQPGDKVLLCSDGLHSMVEDAEIAKLLRNSVKIASDKLIAIANSNGGSDNITVIAAEIRGPAVKGSTKRVNKKTKQIKKRKPRNSSGPIGWIKTKLLRRSR
jgi:protein phosphatase